jgi:hypothetical protein
MLLLFMIKYSRAIAGQNSISKVTSQPETAPVTNNPGETKGISHLITGHKLNGYNFL